MPGPPSYLSPNRTSGRGQVYRSGATSQNLGSALDSPTWATIYCLELIFCTVQIAPLERVFFSVKCVTEHQNLHATSQSGHEAHVMGRLIWVNTLLLLKYTHLSVPWKCAGPYNPRQRPAVLYYISCWDCVGIVLGYVGIDPNSHHHKPRPTTPQDFFEISLFLYQIDKFEIT